MFKRVFIFAFLAIPGIAQVISSVRGAVTADEPLTGNHFVVHLTDAVTRREVCRSFVAADGSFEFHDVAAGYYTVELAVSGGDPIQQETINLNSSADRIELRLPERERNNGAAGTVSVRELRLPAKAKRIFARAEKAQAKGEYSKAIGILRGALNDPGAAPYARLNIGVAYTRAGQPGAAIPEFEEAVRLMADDAMARTNLAYALLMTRRIGAAEEQAQRALRIDRNNSRARLVLGAILLSKGSRVEEGVEDLRLASREIPKARVMLAEYYERSGQKDAAARELRAFLPEASAGDRAAAEQWLSKLVAK